MTVRSLGRPAAPPSPDSLRFAAERAQDRAPVAARIHRAFGPGRFAKTAERLREVAIAFLGPIAVEREHRGHGLGAARVERALERARGLKESGVILVGDMSFFGPFGFAPVGADRVSLPGPVDPKRLLWLPLFPGALDQAAGRLTAGPA